MISSHLTRELATAGGSRSACAAPPAVVEPSSSRRHPGRRRGDEGDRGGRATAASSNDVTVRPVIWWRYAGDDWAAYDQLPPAIRRRLTEHAYDAWSVNALILWRRYRRLHPTEQRAERALLRYLDHCERLERRAFATDHLRRHGDLLPHDAARVTVLRYDVALAGARRGRGPCCPGAAP